MLITSRKQYHLTRQQLADRAALASDLLDSLPAVLSDADEGLAEALRRDAELDRDPTAAMTLDDLRRSLGRS